MKINCNILGAIEALLYVQNIFHMFKGCKYITNIFCTYKRAAMAPNMLQLIFVFY